MITRSIVFFFCFVSAGLAGEVACATSSHLPIAIFDLWDSELQTFARLVCPGTAPRDLEFTHARVEVTQDLSIEEGWRAVRHVLSIEAVDDLSDENWDDFGAAYCRSNRLCFQCKVSPRDGDAFVDCDTQYFRLRQDDRGIYRSVEPFPGQHAGGSAATPSGNSQDIHRFRDPSGNSQDIHRFRDPNETPWDC